MDTRRTGGRYVLSAVVSVVAAIVLASAAGCHGNDPVGAAVDRLLASAAVKEDAGDTDAIVAALVALGEPAVPHLARALGDSRENVRLVAVGALGRVRGDAAVDALLGGLADRSDTVRLEVVRKLGEMRARKAVPALLDRYRKDEDDQVRYECLTSLGLIGDRAAVGLLVQETSNPDQYVRMWAMDALCTMQDEHAPTLALTLMGDTSRYVREQVMRSCGGALDTPDGHRMLIEFALANPEFEATVWARRNLQSYVKAHGDAMAETIRSTALAELHGPRGLRAALLLGDLGDEAATDRLIEALQDPDAWVRHHAAFLLARIGEPRAVPGLIGALGDEVELVAVTAYTSLQEFADRGDDRAKKALESYKGRRPTARVAH